MSECTSLPKTLTQWNEASSAADKATDKLRSHLGALAELSALGARLRRSRRGEGKAPSHRAQPEVPRSPLDRAGSALPPRQPWLHHLEESRSEARTAWLTRLWNQGKSLPQMKSSKGSLVSPSPPALLHVLPAAPSQVLPCPLPSRLPSPPKGAASKAAGGRAETFPELGAELRTISQQSCLPERSLADPPEDSSNEAGLQLSPL